MNEEDLQELFDAQERKLRAVSSAFHRSLYPEIDWNDRLLCIKGPKGTGKTTMLLQRIKEAFPDPSVALYASLDSLWFATHRVQDVAAWLDSHGGTHLFLDEVHHFENWQTLVKNLHDDFPALHLVYSGSSSRRAAATFPAGSCPTRSRGSPSASSSPSKARSTCPPSAGRSCCAATPPSPAASPRA